MKKLAHASPSKLANTVINHLLLISQPTNKFLVFFLPLNSMANVEIAEEDTAGQFQRFDLATDDSDHRYLNLYKRKKGNATNGPDSFSNASSRVHKKIMEEWKVLERNLPESIYVRVYERRIDLLRAAIVGAAGTPYHDGLFFFDLAFPPDYPNQPPHVSYHSFGLRLNPNLYADGSVCLSLLNTWIGKRNEKWNPAESTVLQVLVSIQGLVLNKEPYFNEPGAGLFPGRAKKSMAYSENTFVLSCKTMICLLAKPPKNFEVLVTSHFRRRARDVLAACNAYVDGRVRAGSYAENGSVSSLSSIDVSRNFKAAMKVWYPELVAAFHRNKASVRDFVEQMRADAAKTASLKTAATANGRKTKNKITASCKVLTAKKKWIKTASLRGLVIKKTKSGIGKVIRKLKKILGLKKVGKRSTEGIKVNSP